MVGWLSDRVLSLLKRNLRDNSNNIHRNNLFIVFHWEGPCPSCWTYFKGYCYLVNNSIKTWHQAQAYCNNLVPRAFPSKNGWGRPFFWGKSPGNEVATVKDWVKIWWRQQWRAKRVCTEAGEQCAPSLRQVWLALEWNPQRKAFLWADNSIPTFKKWFAGEPNGNAHEPCSNFWSRQNPPGINGHWNDLSCWNQNVPCGIVYKRLP